MRPPYLVCARYCPHFDRCAPILALITEAELAGRPHPMSLALEDGCPMRGMPVTTMNENEDD